MMFDGKTNAAQTDLAHVMNDAAGQAALLLIESLIHELAATGIVPRDRALAVVEIATDAAGEIARTEVAEATIDGRVEHLLQAITHTLALDHDK